MQERHSKTPGAIDLVFHIPLTFDFRSANVLRIELYINDTVREQVLMRRWSTSKSAFTIHNKYWQATELNETTDAVVFFHITRGTSIRPASNDFTSLRVINGNTYVLRHLLSNNHSRKHGETRESKKSEPNTAVEVDSTSESKAITEHNTDIEFDVTSESRDFKRFKHDTAIEGDNNTPDDSPRSIGSEYFDAEEGAETTVTHGVSEEIATENEGDDPTRMDQATPATSMDGPQPDSTLARSSSDTPAQSTTKTHTETLDEAEHEDEQDPKTVRVAS
jgi:hypothetical protein